MDKNTRDLLVLWAETYNDPKYFEEDPISFPRRFAELERSGKASVTDLNTARTESDNAVQKYIKDLSSFWTYYYTLRKLTLYDFLAGDDLTVDYEEMTQ